jgi:MFS family permease
MTNNVQIFSSLSRTQKEAVGLLSIGTFLEFFDLMLYVHLAVLLNELFFPKTDPYTAALLTAFAFCSTFMLRPLGALIFGWIGDNIGRKPTVIITTTMMAISCVIMANLPTYAQIGVTAAWGITICRIFQGLSSMGEIICAEIYLTELIKPPIRYPMVCLMQGAASVGGMAALAIATTTFVFKIDWRVAFWIGAIVALVGTVARTVLRETPDFADAKRRIKKKYEKSNIDQKALKDDIIFNEKVRVKTSLAYFLIQCGFPLCFYFKYIYCGEILKKTFNYSAQQVIQHNLMVSLTGILAVIVLMFLSYKIHPIRIFKVILAVFSFFILFVPFLLSNISSPFQLFLIQAFLSFFAINGIPANAIFFVHFPIFKRFTYVSFLFASARSLMHIVVSFGLVYFIDKFGNNGLLVIFIPITAGSIFGTLHFEKLEKAAGNYHLNLYPNPLTSPS